MKRRDFLRNSSIIAGAAAMGGWGLLPSTASTEGEVFEITKTPEEWKAVLTPDEFAVLRQEATERPFTSDLLGEKRKGVFTCAGCDLPLYSSETKYKSGTGWPSFWDVLPNAIGTREDNSLFMTRTECHCRRCGGHLGHIFDDGPQPTGKRHCINGIALDFVPTEEQTG